MGVVNTTYTFSGTDTITSAKLNNIIDDTTFTSDAIQGTTLQVVSPGKLAVSASGITSNELASNSVVTAKIADSSVIQAKLGTNVVGNGPAFRAEVSNTSIPNETFQKVVFSTEVFDTGSCFASSRFTPTISGYYFIAGSIDFLANVGAIALITKNNVQINLGTAGGRSSQVSDLIYMNGTTDYIELNAYQVSGSTRTLENTSFGNYFFGYLARSA
jgi:hypothetical protein